MNKFVNNFILTDPTVQVNQFYQVGHFPTFIDHCRKLHTKTFCAGLSNLKYGKHLYRSKPVGTIDLDLQTMNYGRFPVQLLKLKDFDLLYSPVGGVHFIRIKTVLCYWLFKQYMFMYGKRR